MKKKNNKLTEKQKIKLFKKRVNYFFFDIFKLYDYNLEIIAQKNIDARATTYWHHIEEGSGLITIAYSESWLFYKDTDEKEIDIVAFHEVWEAILWELQSIAASRFIEERSIPNAAHRVIRRMENIIYPLVR